MKRRDLPRRHRAHRGKRVGSGDGPGDPGGRGKHSKCYEKKGGRKWLMGSESWVAGEDNVALSHTDRIAEEREDETGTLSVEPYLDITAFVTICQVRK